MSKLDKLSLALVRWPLLWGSLASLIFYALIQQGLINGEFSERYFTSHPVEYISITMFFVGIAALVVKGIELAAQFGSLPRVSLGATPPGGQQIAEVDSLLQRLNGVSAAWYENYLVRRLREALQYVERKGSADTLDEHLRYASDLDVGRMQSSYALVRIIIWAIPILGFLGTVIGITLAIANLSPEDLENSMPQVVHGLKIAFDTTALALALSMILMFAQFIVDRFETNLLEKVDDRVAQELVGRFEELGTATDPQAASIRRMADAVIETTNRLVERQAELWHESLEAAHQKWQSTSTTTAQQLEQVLSSSSKKIEGALAGALALGLKQHAAALTEAERELADQQFKNWREVQQALTASAEAMNNQQVELVRQGELLKQVIEATGEVRNLEQTLNENLAALSASHNFEETVLSLSAALQLLSAQLHGAGSGAVRVDLQSKKIASTSNAA